MASTAAGLPVVLERCPRLRRRRRRRRVFPLAIEVGRAEGAGAALTLPWGDPPASVSGWWLVAVFSTVGRGRKTVIGPLSRRGTPSSLGRRRTKKASCLPVVAVRKSPALSGSLLRRCRRCCWVARGGSSCWSFCQYLCLTRHSASLCPRRWHHQQVMRRGPRRLSLVAGKRWRWLAEVAAVWSLATSAVRAASLASKWRRRSAPAMVSMVCWFWIAGAAAMLTVSILSRFRANEL